MYCTCTADGSAESKLFEYNRLYHPGVPDVTTEHLERTNIAYYLRANVSEIHWTAVTADTSQHLECHVVCQTGHLQIISLLITTITRNVFVVLLRVHIDAVCQRHDLQTTI